MKKIKKSKILTCICMLGLLATVCATGISGKTISYSFKMSNTTSANNTGIVVKEKSGPALVDIQKWVQTDSAMGYLELMTQNEKYTTVSSRTVADHTGKYNVYYNSGEGKVGTSYRLRGEYKIPTHTQSKIETSGYFTP